MVVIPAQQDLLGLRELPDPLEPQDRQELLVQTQRFLDRQDLRVLRELQDQRELVVPILRFLVQPGQPAV